MKKNRKLPVAEVDYTVFDDPKLTPQTHQSFIRLLTGPWKGVEYGYTSIQIVPINEETGETKVSYGYEIIKIPDSLTTKLCRKDVSKNIAKKELQENQEFKNWLGDIVMDILIKNVQELEPGLMPTTPEENGKSESTKS